MTRLATRIGLILVLAGCAGVDDSPEPHSADFYNQNAQRLYDGGHYRQALDQFRKALRNDPDDETALLGRPWCRLLIGEGLILGGDSEGPVYVQQALDELEELQGKRLGPNQFKVSLGMGKAHALLGDLYRQRAELLSSKGVSGERLAEARRKQASSYDRAEQLFHSVLSQRDNPQARDNLTALISLAWISVYRDRFDDALLYAERYLEQVRRSKELWVKSLTEFPDDKALWEVKLAGAVRKEIACRDLIASTLIQLDRFRPAEEELSAVIRLDPDNGDAYLRRGIVRDELGNDTGALEDFDDFLRRAARLELEPSDPRVMEAVRRRNAIREELGMEPDRPIDPEAGEGEAGEEETE